MTYLNFSCNNYIKLAAISKGMLALFGMAYFWPLCAWDGVKTFFKTKLYGPFLWMGFNYLMATEPLRGGSLLFTTKFPEIPGTHLIKLERIKGYVVLENI